MNKYRVRNNGQHDMREIIRTALKERGITQRAAAESIGLTHAQLVTRLNGAVWFARDEVTGLAELLDLGFDELVGESIFYGDPRMAEFDHNRPDHKPYTPPVVYTPGQTRALCCECGSLRTTDHDFKQFEEGNLHWPERQADPRLVLDLDCLTCETVTPHAALWRPTNKDRNKLDDDQHEMSRQRSVAAVALDATIERIKGFNVGIEYATLPTRKSTGEGHTIALKWQRGRWHFTLSPAAPPAMLDAQLKEVWKQLAADDLGVDWDPKASGVWWAPTDRLWSQVASDLTHEIGSVTRAERERITRGAREMARSLDGQLEVAAQAADDAAEMLRDLDEEGDR